jgi:hypothetical protein
MPINWGARCSQIHAAVCVAAGQNEGCEVIGNTCTNHHRADGGTPDVPPGEGGNMSKYELMERKGELCRTRANAKTL